LIFVQTLKHSVARYQQYESQCKTSFPINISGSYISDIGRNYISVHRELSLSQWKEEKNIFNSSFITSTKFKSFM